MSAYVRVISKLLFSKFGVIRENFEEVVAISTFSPVVQNTLKFTPETTE